MQKITLVGKDSGLKTAILVGLNPIYEVQSLYPDQIYNNGNIANLAIYITDKPDQRVINLLHESVKSIVLLSKINGLPNANDQFIPTANFQGFAPEDALASIRAIREFIDQVEGVPKLSKNQRDVFTQLAKDLPDSRNIEDLRISRSLYYSILEQLRIIFEVQKNRQLVLFAKKYNPQLKLAS